MTMHSQGRMLQGGSIPARLAPVVGMIAPFLKSLNTGKWDWERADFVAGSWEDTWHALRIRQTANNSARRDLL